MSSTVVTDWIRERKQRSDQAPGLGSVQKTILIRNMFQYLQQSFGNPNRTRNILDTIPTWPRELGLRLEILMAHKSRPPLCQVSPFGQLYFYQCTSGGERTSRSQGGGATRGIGFQSGNVNGRGRGAGRGGQKPRGTLKRSLNPNEDSDQDDDAPGPHKPAIKKTRYSGLPFACPYFKNTAVRHLYPECAQWKNTSLREVKDHCREHHLKPFRCARCKTFRMGNKDITTLNIHLAGGCDFVNTPDPSRIEDENMSDAIRKAQTWDKIYRLLFPIDVPDQFWRESDVVPRSTIMRTLVASSTSAQASGSATVTTPTTTPAATPATAPAPAPATLTSPSSVPSSSPALAIAQATAIMIAQPSGISVLAPGSHVISADLSHIVLPTLPSASLSLNDPEALPDDLWGHLSAESENIQDQNRAVEYSRIGEFDLGMEYVDRYTDSQSGPSSNYNSWPT
ncbi:hypothetical protein DFP73DRAFT_545010 [Morchella snyderi]|nr:hypothetical protein DFP73DRAFT_545010 [Morchella snyderi]